MDKPGPLNLNHLSSSSLRWIVAVFLYCSQDCLAHLDSTSWVIQTIWAAIKKYSLNVFVTSLWVHWLWKTCIWYFSDIDNTLTVSLWVSEYFSESFASSSSVQWCINCLLISFRWNTDITTLYRYIFINICYKAVLLYSSPAHLNSTGWATWAIWTVIQKHSLNLAMRAAHVNTPWSTPKGGHTAKNSSCGMDQMGPAESGPFVRCIALWMLYAGEL